LSAADLPTYDRGGMEGYKDYTELQQKKQSVFKKIRSHFDIESKYSLREIFRFSLVF
jgi:hypothetical protein